MTAPRSVWIVAWPDGTLNGPYRSEAEAESYRGRWPTALIPAVVKYDIADTGRVVVPLDRDGWALDNTGAV